jgi:hypothetical protein
MELTHCVERLVRGGEYKEEQREEQGGFGPHRLKIHNKVSRSPRQQTPFPSIHAWK